MDLLLMQTFHGGYLLLNSLKMFFFVGEGHIQGLLVEHSPENQLCFHWNEQNFSNRWQVTSFFVKKFHKNKLCHFCKTAN